MSQDKLEPHKDGSKRCEEWGAQCRVHTCAVFRFMCLGSRMWPWQAKAVQWHLPAIGCDEHREYKADRNASCICRCSSFKVTLATIAKHFAYLWNIHELPQSLARESKDVLLARFIEVSKADCEMNLYLIRAKPGPQPSMLSMHVSFCKLM